LIRRFGEVENMLMSAFTVEDKITIEDSGQINVRYMNGQIKSRKNAIGYCSCSKHRGWMTKDDMCEHDCCEKECRMLYYAISDFDPIAQEQRKREKNTVKMEKRLISEVCDILSLKYEGVRIYRCEKNRDEWIMRYVTIGSFDEEAMRRDIESATGGRLNFKLVMAKLDFDASVAAYMKSGIQWV